MPDLHVNPAECRSKATRGTYPPAVTVYWRPGCPYCAALRRQLRRHQVSVEWRNIWQEPSAAAFVRSAAHGNETVPTVVVGGDAHVNPTWSQLRDLLIAGGYPLPARVGWRDRRRQRRAVRRGDR